MKKDDGVIDLRTAGDKATEVEDDFDDEMEPEEEAAPEFLIQHEPKPLAAAEDFEKSSDRVRVKFDKFVNLVDSKVDDDFLDKYMHEDVIVSTALLTELAGTDQTGSNRKYYYYLLLGVAIGLAVAWYFFSA